MKSIQLFLLALLSAMIMSCEKLSLPEETTTNPKGNLTLTIYQIEQIPFESSTRDHRCMHATQLSCV